MPTALESFAQTIPISLGRFDLKDRRCGLVIVDEVNGFATVGAGPLAPVAENEQINRMIEETGRIAHLFSERGAPIMAFLDTHIPGKPEPPYPPHCEQGTGQENLVAALQWLEKTSCTTFLRKDCINGFIGAIDLNTGHNAVCDWITQHHLDSIVVVGICTDICVMDFVLTLLSARNHDLTPPLQDIIVYEPGCATYDLSRQTALELGLPAHAIHPQKETHHMGLYCMAARGAVLVAHLDNQPIGVS